MIGGPSSRFLLTMSCSGGGVCVYRGVEKKVPAHVLLRSPRERTKTKLLMDCASAYRYQLVVGLMHSARRVLRRWAETVSPTLQFGLHLILLCTYMVRRIWSMLSFVRPSSRLRNEYYFSALGRKGFAILNLSRHLLQSMFRLHNRSKYIAVDTL